MSHLLEHAFLLISAAEPGNGLIERAEPDAQRAGEAEYGAVKLAASMTPRREQLAQTREHDACAHGMRERQRIALAVLGDEAHAGRDGLNGRADADPLPR